MTLRSTTRQQQQQPSSSSSTPIIRRPSSFIASPGSTNTTKLPNNFSNSRPVSYSRGESSRQRQPEYMETTQPSTPTPKKGRKPRGGKQRSRVNDPNEAQDDQNPSTEDEEELLNLLGVTSPAPVARDEEQGQGKNQTAEIPGVLRISKAEVNAATKVKQRGRKPKNESDGIIDRETAPSHSPSPAVRNGNGRSRKAKDVEEGQQDDGAPRAAQSGRKSKDRPRKDKTSAMVASVSLPQPISGLTASRPLSSKPAPQPAVHNAADTSDAFETSSLSRSLPTGGLFAPGPEIGTAPTVSGPKKGKGRKKQDVETGDESAVWEMPAQAGSGEGLTWQQKLQSSTSTTDSPRRSNKSTPQTGSSINTKPRSRPTTNPLHLPNPPSSMTSSPLLPRPAHGRRRSLDTVIQPSAFDSTIPFHTGFNVHRAPQTPVKLPTSVNPSAGLPLLQGEFPRISNDTKASNGAKAGVGHGAPAPAPPPQIQGIKYAGPTFHNSPHGASLPKPDLEDF